eukprot:979238_1
MYSRMYGMNPRMMQMMYMLGSPYVQQALPYMSMGYTPNLFGHGMPIYHGTRFDNEPLPHHPAMAHQSFITTLYSDLVSNCFVFIHTCDYPVPVQQTESSLKR